MLLIHLVIIKYQIRAAELNCVGLYSSLSSPSRGQAHSKAARHHRGRDTVTGLVIWTHQTLGALSQPRLNDVRVLLLGEGSEVRGYTNVGKRASA